jgi:hypothetical protein
LPASLQTTLLNDSVDRPQIRRHLLNWAGELLKSDESDPASYALRRCALWSFPLKLPGSDGRRTNIPAPPEGFLAKLRALVDSGQGASISEAIFEAEEASNRNAFWLDLSEVTKTGLEKRGFKRALEVLNSAAVSLIEAAPDLLGCEFDNGTPVADQRTKSWLGFLVRNSGTAQTDEDDIPKAFPSSSEALKALGRLMEKGAGGRRRLLIMGKLFPVLAKVGRWGQIEPLAEEALRLIKRHALIDFEPDLAAGVLEAAWSAWLSFPDGPVKVRAAEDGPGAMGEVFSLLAGISPHRIL